MLNVERAEMKSDPEFSIFCNIVVYHMTGTLKAGREVRRCTEETR